MLVSEFNLKVTKGNIKGLLLSMVDQQMNMLELDPIPKFFIEQYIQNKRSDLINYSISLIEDDSEVVDLSFLPENKASAKHLLKMIEYLSAEEFVLPPIPLEHINDYVEGRRDQLLHFSLGKVEEGDVKKDE